MKKKKHHHNIFDLKNRFKRYKRRKDKEKHKKENRIYSDIMLDMIEIYKPDDEDWMGFKLSDSNTYTFHHIKEERQGGKKEVKNGAILTLYGHQFLNHLDSHNKRAYNDYQNLFRRINEAHGAIDDDLREDIYGMLLDVFYYNIYDLPKEILRYYEPFTENKKKVKK